MARRRGHRESFEELVGLWVDLFRKHNLLTYACAIAFRALIAVVALVLLGVALLHGFGRDDVWTSQIAPQIAPKLLPPVFSGLDATVQTIFSSSSAGLIAFASVLATWEVSAMVRACMGALSAISGHEDDRPWWIRFPISVGIAFVLTLAIVGAVLLGTAAKGAVGGAWEVPYSIGRWLLAVVLIGLAFGVLVRFAPAAPHSKKWATGGTTLVVVAWVVQSLLFAAYLRSFANYKTAEGSLLGIYFVTTFLYVAAIILLVGIELDEQLRKDLKGKDRGIIEIVRDVI